MHLMAEHRCCLTNSIAVERAIAIDRSRLCSFKCKLYYFISGFKSEHFFVSYGCFVQGRRWWHGISIRVQVQVWFLSWLFQTTSIILKVKYSTVCDIMASHKICNSSSIHVSYRPHCTRTHPTTLPSPPHTVPFPSIVITMFQGVPGLHPRCVWVTLKPKLCWFSTSYSIQFAKPCHPHQNQRHAGPMRS